MAITDVSREFIHVLLLEHISDQSIRFSLEQLLTHASDDSRGILASVLQNSEPIIYGWRSRLSNLGDDANDTTHSATQFVVI